VSAVLVRNNVFPKSFKAKNSAADNQCSHFHFDDILCHLSLLLLPARKTPSTAATTATTAAATENIYNRKGKFCAHNEKPLRKCK
jgi:hypothetical protein